MASNIFLNFFTGAKSEFVQFLFSIIVVYVLARAALRLLLRLIAAAARCALVIGLILSPVIALAILNPAGTSAAGMWQCISDLLIASVC